MKVKINIPTSLDEIPLKRYQDFLKVQSTSTDEEFVAQKMIEIFCGVELKDVVKIKVTDLNDLIQHFTKLFSEKPKLKQTFVLGNYEFGFIPNLEDITFGEYVDLDAHVQNWSSYHKAMAVLYRPIKIRTKNGYEIIDYEPNVAFQDLMQYAPLSVAISASLFFLEFRKRIVSSYNELFTTRDEEEQNNFSDFTERGQFNKTWGWYGSIYAIAKGDATKFDEVTRLRLTKCLTYLTFEKQKNQIEHNELRKQYRQ